MKSGCGLNKEGKQRRHEMTKLCFCVGVWKAMDEYDDDVRGVFFFSLLLLLLLGKGI